MKKPSAKRRRIRVRSEVDEAFSVLLEMLAERHGMGLPIARERASFGFEDELFASIIAKGNSCYGIFRCGYNDG